MEFRKKKRISKQGRHIDLSLVTLLICLQSETTYNTAERAAGWRIFESLLRQYINDKRKKRRRRKHG